MDSMVQLPLSILSVASTLPDYDLLLIDERIENNALSNLEKKSSNAICVGVSAMTGRQILGGLEASKTAKNYTQVIWGGIHPTLQPQQTLCNSNIDIVVRGEGELAFPEVVKALETGSDLSKIRGIGFKGKRGEKIITQDRNFADMNTLPELPYHMLDVEKYITQREGFSRCLNLQTSRGCPHDCSFCINPVYNKRRWRGFSAYKMVDITEKLKNRYKINGIIYQEDNFFANIQRVLEFCRILQERNLDIGWKANCRISYLVDKDLSFFCVLEKSGCRVLQFGVESGSDRILGILRKGITVEQVTMVNRKLARANIKCRYNFMIGIPGETYEETKMTLRFIQTLKKQNRNLESCFLNIYTPWPGTELYWRSIENGFVPPQTLESWSSFNWNETLMPWIDKKTAKTMKNISGDYLTKSGYFEQV
jgi:radical SAM superfamily enzyme YgiQ (UPF0313 family)